MRTHDMSTNYSYTFDILCRVYKHTTHVHIFFNKLTITNTNHAVMAAMAGSHIADTSVNCSCCSLLLVGDVVGVVSTQFTVDIQQMPSTLRR